MHASSVNPVDVFIAAGGLKQMAGYEFPVILGRDFARVVEQAASPRVLDLPFATHISSELHRARYGDPERPRLSMKCETQGSIPREDVPFLVRCSS